MRFCGPGLLTEPLSPRRRCRMGAIMSEYENIVRIVFDNLDVIAWATDAQGTVKLSEGGALQAIGMRPGQFVGVNVLDLYKDRPETLGPVKQALAGEAHTSLSVENGRILETQFRPIRGPSSEILGIAGLSSDVTEREQARQELARQTDELRRLAELLDLTQDAIMTRTIDGTITYWNRGAERLYGHERGAAVGRDSHELLRTCFPTELAAIDRHLRATGYWNGELTHVRADGQEIVVASRWVLKRGEDGQADEVLELNTDVSARKRAEAEEAQRQQVLLAQAQAIQELSTPLIPVTDDILVMPMIGTVDSIRAKQIMEAILRGVADSRARYVILDITGVLVVDTAVAGALLRTAHATRLLGAEVIITGIRPEIAQTLVQIEANLERIVTRGTLQSGIAFALGKRQLDV
ncbi:PAS domain S-box protein [Nannocystis pusilla]|uniref:PAS domain S-box protein n=1 Tax=Nannocystis pusilla TaxID=889268 RepID=A0ABS7TRX6_9BACT|nr:PAS domain S-box protein [Nannocystis pusilla]MBZ5710985.1 PAS domain S-box protein [Nannocystis pusilla]